MLRDRKRTRTARAAFFGAKRCQFGAIIGLALNRLLDGLIYFKTKVFCSSQLGLVRRFVFSIDFLKGLSKVSKLKLVSISRSRFESSFERSNWQIYRGMRGEVACPTSYDSH